MTQSDAVVTIVTATRSPGIERALRPSEVAWLRGALLACGVASSVLYLAAIDVLAPLLHPDYHDYTSQMVSELMALEAPTRPLMVPVMWLYNALVFALAAGVRTAAEGRRARLLTARALAGYAVFSTLGLVLAPMDLRTAGVSDQTALHILDTALQGLFMVLVFACGAFVHGARFRLYSLASLATSLAFGALASLAATQPSMPSIGLTERISIYTWMLWLAVLAASLMRPAPGIGGAEARPTGVPAPA